MRHPPTGPIAQESAVEASDLAGRLRFIQEAARLKDVLRSGRTASGRQESTAEHSWRLCLLAMTLADQLGPLDMNRMLQLCIVHDLGEALNGDVPAVLQQADPGKSAREREDLCTLTDSLPTSLRQQFLALWDEYEAAQTREARLVKALDKLETIIQHNQGANGPEFDHGFNLGYGRRYTDADPILARLRELVDQDTARLAGRA
jgi:putative hydrolases of HD superfamily